MQWLLPCVKTNCIPFISKDYQSVYWIPLLLEVEFTEMEANDALNKYIYLVSVVTAIWQEVCCTNTGFIVCQQSYSMFRVHTNSSRTMNSFWIELCIHHDLRRRTAFRAVQNNSTTRTFPVTVTINVGLIYSYILFFKETVSFLLRRFKYSSLHIYWI